MRGTTPTLQIAAENFPLVAKVASCRKMDIVHQILKVKGMKLCEYAYFKHMYFFQKYC